MTARRRGTRFAAAAVTLLVVLATIAPAAAFPTNAAVDDGTERVSAPWSPPTHAATEGEEAPNPSLARNFEITDGFESGGAVVVNVTNFGVAEGEFNVFYDGSTEPLNVSNGNVTATTTPSGVTQLTLDSGEAPYSPGATAIRVTQGSENTSYASTADSHRAVLTVNYVSFTATNATGTPLAGRPFVYYDASTNETLGMSMTSPTGSFVQHCRGVVSGTDCVLPSDGTTTSTVFTPSRLAAFGPTPPAITGTVRVDVYDMAASNGTGKAQVAPGSHAALTADTPVAPRFVEATPLGGTYRSPTELVVTDRDTGVVVYEWNKTTSPVSSPQPFFASPTEQYRISLSVTDGSTTYGPFEYAFMTPTKGMGQIGLKYQTGASSTAPVTGQVVNGTGAPVEGVVFAEKFVGEGSAPTSATVINATHTDTNGKFEMRLPVTSQTAVNGKNVRYQFRVVSNETSDTGTPLYYPTTFANDGDGYAALDTRTVLPPMTIEQGGVVAVALRNESGSLPSSNAIAELSRTTLRNGRTVRTAETSSFAQLAFDPSRIPSQGSLSLISPTSGPESSLVYNVWALSQSSMGVDFLCAEGVGVSQGSTTASTCTFEESGTLNLSVTAYDSAVQQSSGQSEAVGRWSYFAENTLVVRNASTGDVVTYIGGGIQSYFLGGMHTYNASVPLPAGDYTVELAPRYEFMERTDVTHTQAMTVTAGGTTDLTLSRAADFEIERQPGRFPGSVTRSADNTVAVSVFDPATGSALSDTELTVTGQFLYDNGTEASDSFALSYNGSATPTPVVDTETLQPATLGVDAGRYVLAVTATHATADETYNTTRRFPVEVSGFSTSLELSRRSVGTGDDVAGVVRAFDTTGDTPTAIAADASGITITVSDENGKQVSETTASSGLTDGKTAVSVSMPDTQGLYKLSVLVESNGGSQGIAQEWVRVSDLRIDTSTPKDSYGPTDTVNLTVSVTDASTGDAVGDAGITVGLNGNETTKTTDATGESTFSLPPSTFGRDGAWQGDQFAEVTVTKEESAGVVRQTTGVGFDVSSVTAFVEPRRGSFGADETAYVDVYTPPGTTVRSVTLTRLNDEGKSVAATEVASGYHELDLGTLPVGEYTASVRVSTDTGEQTFQASFAVESFMIEAEPGKFRYDTNEAIPIDVTLRHTNGSVVAGQQVNATLFYADSRIEKASASATTGADGTATISGLSSDENGQHFVEVEADGQRRLLGLQVSDLTATLLDGAGGTSVDGYTWAPGTDQTVHVDVDVGGSPAADGATVTAFVDAYENRIELGSGETAGGEVSIPVIVPEGVAAGTYGLTVRVQTASGTTGYTYGFVEIAGGSALSVDLSTDDRVYAPGDDATLSSTVTDASGAPVSGKTVEFTLASENSPEETLGTAATDAGGTAEYTYSVPADKTNGEYVVRAKLAETPSIKDVSGFQVSSFGVDVTPNETAYTPGDTVGLDVTVTDRTSGAAATATDGVVHIVAPGGTERLVDVGPSGSSPYTVSFDLPDDDSATGSYSVDVMMRNDNAVGVGSTLVEVASATESTNLSVPERVTAGETATVTVNGTLTTTGTLTVFSPGAESTAYRNESVPISPTDTAVDVTVDSAGVYVFKLEAPNVGTRTEIVTVEPAADAVPSLLVGPDLSSTSANFSTTEDIYVRTDQAGATATLVGPDETFEVSLNRQDGSTYYGVLSKQRAADTYLVRLDTANATAVNETVVEVEA